MQTISDVYDLADCVALMTDGTKNNEYQLVSRKGGRPENETEE